MLHGLRLIDIGNHKDTTLRLGPLTAILGPNGAGKTTVLNAIGYVTSPMLEGEWIIQDHIVRSNLGTGALVGVFCHHRTPQITAARRVSADTMRGGAQVSLSSRWVVRKSRHNVQWQPDPFDEKVWFSGPPWTKPDDYASVLQIDRKLAEEEMRATDDVSITGLSFAHPHVRYLQLSTQLLKRPSYSESVTPIMADEGTDLASVLAHLMTSDRITFATIVEAVRKVVPTVKDIRATRCPMTITESRSVTVNKREVPYSEPREVIGQQLRFDMTSGEDLPAERISDGTMLVLAIVTILKTMPGALILLDDLEQGLHPSAQREVIQLIKAIQKDDPEMQVVFTTHSPYIVDELEPENVWVLGLDKEGCAHAKALSEHPNAKRAMEVLTTGEFWSAEGEDWVVSSAE